jgi:succinate dehydrogenase / fumarate reductase cytochrome b subunit
MSWLGRFLLSTIGLKIVMAVSGLMLVGFVLAHMLGNLQVFLGPDAINAYGTALQSNQAILWVARSGLILAVLAHIGSAAKLTMLSKAARPVATRKHSWFDQRYAVRTMRWGGIIILAFIVYHLLHFTAGMEGVHPDFVSCGDKAGEFACDVYHNIISGFQVWPVAAFYIVAQVFLGLHLTHGIWSMSRTLGQGNPRWDAIARQAAVAVGIGVTIGNCSIPIAVLAGVLS